MAIGMLFGTGALSVISRYLGAKKYDKAYMAAGNVLLYSILAGFVFLIPAMIFIEPLLKLFGATDTLLPCALEYIKVILLGAPLMAFLMSGNNIARSEGRAKVAMVSMIIGTGLNLVLDPLN